MAIPKFLEDLLIISKLGDNPGSDNGLSSSGLRAKFDEAGVKIQQYINNTLIPALSELADPTAGLNMRGNISMGGHRVTGLGEPVADGDAVPLGYAGHHFAPAGYGLGVAVPDSVTDCNSAVKSGWYRTEQATLNQPMPRSCWMRVDAYSEGWTHQVWFYDQENCGELHRYQKNGDWEEWEWENPPMQEDVPYRTTERWKGKPVYTKLINLGILETGNHTKNIGIRGVNTGASPGLIRHYCFTATGRTAQSGGTTVPDWAFSVSIGDGNVYINCGQGIGGNSEQAYIQVWYIMT